MNTTPTMSEASSTSLRMAVEAARAAVKAAAHTAALILIEANGGRGSILRDVRRREGEPDASCVVVTDRLTVHFLADAHGDRVQFQLTGITPAAYERMRTWAEGVDDCRHDHNCECLKDPWPTLDFITRNGAESRIDYRADYEDERGTASIAFGRVTITLFDEPVTVADTLLRIAHSTA
ncbi:hypothetical protein ABT224_33335 [Streptomyces sp. NPDC001584]|uniref:hypothetical protein n=1 Tax=Streptomyces sp. NPDC001584 TaxID=3154521 RepID=UPI003325EFF7